MCNSFTGAPKPTFQPTNLAEIEQIEAIDADGSFTSATEMSIFTKTVHCSSPLVCTSVLLNEPSIVDASGSTQKRYISARAYAPAERLARTLRNGSPDTMTCAFVPVKPNALMLVNFSCFVPEFGAKSWREVINGTEFPVLVWVERAAPATNLFIARRCRTIPWLSVLLVDNALMIEVIASTPDAHSLCPLLLLSAPKTSASLIFSSLLSVLCIVELPRRIPTAAPTSIGSPSAVPVP